jgi:L-rhamnose mutarotase
MSTAVQKYCLILDLIDDAQLIAEYKVHHQNVWPEIIKSIEDSGIIHMEIYLLGNRLTMTIDAESSFSFEQKAKMDQENPKVQEWEKLMWKYQQALPMASPGEKWMLMEKIFEF